MKNDNRSGAHSSGSATTSSTAGTSKRAVIIRPGKQNYSKYLTDAAILALQKRNEALFRFVMLSPERRRELLSLAGYDFRTQAVAPIALSVINACLRPSFEKEISEASFLFHLITQLKDGFSQEILSGLFGGDRVKQECSFRYEKENGTRTPDKLSFSELNRERVRLFLDMLQCERLISLREKQLESINNKKIESVFELNLLLGRVLSDHARRPDANQADTIVDGLIARLKAEPVVKECGIVFSWRNDEKNSELALDINQDMHCVVLAEAFRSQVFCDEAKLLQIKIAECYEGVPDNGQVGEGVDLPRIGVEMNAILRSTSDRVMKKSLEPIVVIQIKRLIDLKNKLQSDRENLDRVALRFKTQSSEKRQGFVEKVNEREEALCTALAQGSFPDALLPVPSVVTSLAVDTTGDTKNIILQNLGEEKKEGISSEEIALQRKTALRALVQKLKKASWSVGKEALTVMDDDGNPLLAYLACLGRYDEIIALLRCVPEALLAELGGERGTVVACFKQNETTARILKDWIRENILAPLQGIASLGLNAGIVEDQTKRWMTCFASDAICALSEEGSLGKTPIEVFWEIPVGRVLSVDLTNPGRQALPDYVWRVELLSYFLRDELAALKRREGVTSLLAMDILRVLANFEIHVAMKMRTPVEIDSRFKRVHEERKLDSQFFLLACWQLVKDYGRRGEPAKVRANEKRVMDLITSFSWTCLHRNQIPGWPASVFYGVLTQREVSGELSANPGLCGIAHKYKAGQYNSESNARAIAVFDVVRAREEHAELVAAQHAVEVAQLQEDKRNAHAQISQLSDERDGYKVVAEEAVAKATAADKRAAAAVERAIESDKKVMESDKKVIESNQKVLDMQEELKQSLIRAVRSEEEKELYIKAMQELFMEQIQGIKGKVPGEASQAGTSASAEASGSGRRGSPRMFGSGKS